MADQTGVGVVKEERGQMMSTGFQVNAKNERRKETAVRSRSDIVGADTTVAPGIDGDRDGAHSLQTTPRTNCGGTAGEEGNLLPLGFLGLPSNPSAVSETLAVVRSLRWMVEVSSFGISIEEEPTLFLSAHLRP